jgi:hypothetical protein
MNICVIIILFTANTSNNFNTILCSVYCMLNAHMYGFVQIYLNFVYRFIKILCTDGTLSYVGFVPILKKILVVTLYQSSSPCLIPIQ